jgi:hypothetical protein
LHFAAAELCLLHLVPMSSFGPRSRAKREGAPPRHRARALVGKKPERLKRSIECWAAWARLNSVAAIYEYEVDAQGNTKGEVWEWK